MRVLSFDGALSRHVKVLRTPHVRDDPMTKSRIITTVGQKLIQLPSYSWGRELKSNSSIRRRGNNATVRLRTLYKGKAHFVSARIPDQRSQKVILNRVSYTIDTFRYWLEYAKGSEDLSRHYSPELRWEIINYLTKFKEAVTAPSVHALLRILDKRERNRRKIPKRKVTVILVRPPLGRTSQRT